MSVCAACAVYTDMDGEIICGMVTAGFSACHDCHETIDWGTILSAGIGQPNYRIGTCACGDAWLTMENDEKEWCYEYRG